jgi:hypothetical protein
MEILVAGPSHLLEIVSGRVDVLCPEWMFREIERWEGVEHEAIGRVQRGDPCGGREPSLRTE